MAEPAAAVTEPFACGQNEGDTRRTSGSKDEIPAMLPTDSCLNQDRTSPRSDAMNELPHPRHDQADEPQPAPPSSANVIDGQEHVTAESNGYEVGDDAQVKIALDDLLLKLMEEREQQVETRMRSLHAVDQELQTLTRTFSQLSFDSDRARDESHKRCWAEHESAPDSADELVWSDEEAESDYGSDAEADGALRSRATLTLGNEEASVCPLMAGSPLHHDAHTGDESMLCVSDLDEQAALSESVDPCDVANALLNVSLPTEVVPVTSENDSVVIEFIATESLNDSLGGFSNLAIFEHEPLEDISDDACSAHDDVSCASDCSSVSDSANQEQELSSTSEQMAVPSNQEHDDCADWVDVPNQVHISSPDSISSMAEKEEEPHPESPANSPKLLTSKSFLLPVEMSFGDRRLSIEEMTSSHQHQAATNTLSCQADHSIGSDTLGRHDGCQLHESMGVQQLREQLGRMTKQIVYLTKMLRDPSTLDKWKDPTDSDARDDSWNLLIRMSSDATAELSDESIANEKSTCVTCSTNISDACFRLACDRKAEISVEGNTNDDDYHEQVSRLTEHNMKLKKEIAYMQERERATELENNDLLSTVESLKLQLAKIEHPLAPTESVKDQGYVESDTFNTLFLGHQDFEQDMKSRSTSGWMSALLNRDGERASRYDENPGTLDQQRKSLSSQACVGLNCTKTALGQMTKARNTESIGEQNDGDEIRPLPFSNQHEPIQWLNLENAHVLVNHERCQERRRELMDTVKILRGYVDVYRSQKDDMKRQRDEAIVSAEKAWDQNAKLVSSTNPKQKIQYTMQMKNDNVLLHSRVRELQTKIASQVSAPYTAILDSEYHDESAPQSSSKLCVSDLEDSEDPARLVLFHKMQAYMEQREVKIQQLKKQRLALGCSQSERSPSSSSFTPSASVRSRHSSLRIRS